MHDQGMALGGSSVPPFLHACTARREKSQAMAKATLNKQHPDLMTHHVGNNNWDGS